MTTTMPVTVRTCATALLHLTPWSRSTRRCRGTCRWQRLAPSPASPSARYGAPSRPGRCGRTTSAATFASNWPSCSRGSKQMAQPGTCRPSTVAARTRPANPWRRDPLRISTNRGRRHADQRPAVAARRPATGVRRAGRGEGTCCGSRHSLSARQQPPRGLAHEHRPRRHLRTVLVGQAGSSSIEDQTRICQNWAETNGLAVVAVFADEATSGSVPVTRRAGGGAMHAAALARQFHVLSWRHSTAFRAIRSIRNKSSVDWNTAASASLAFPMATIAIRASPGSCCAACAASSTKSIAATCHQRSGVDWPDRSRVAFTLAACPMATAASRSA